LSGVPVLDHFTFTPEDGENTFSFDVLTRGVTGTPPPAGVIYVAAISYTLPDVVWLPPIVGTGRTILKNGTTLPIKFALKLNGKVLSKEQDVYLSITGPDPSTQEVARFTSGQDLKFAGGNGKYQAEFHSKLYKLQAGQTYTVSVKDTCSDAILGSITMTISGKQPHGQK
jgi:hypothetical protein